MVKSHLPDSQQPTRSLSQRALRWLLELDRPFRDLTEEELAAQAERDYRWNRTVNVGDGTFFLFGAAFLTSSTILPLFLSKVKGSICQIDAAFGGWSGASWKRSLRFVRQ